MFFLFVNTFRRPINATFFVENKQYLLIMSFYNYSMSYKVDEIDNKRVVHLNGEIDMEVSDKARNTILPLIEAGHEVQINLSKVDYMDSSGISVLIESKKLSEQKKQSLN